MKFVLKPHHFYKRPSPHSADLTATVKVAMIDLVIGTSLKYTDLNGKTREVTIPAGIKGNTLRIQNGGLPIFNRESQRGDLYLKLEIGDNDLDDKTLDKIRKIVGKNRKIDVTNK